MSPIYWTPNRRPLTADYRRGTPRRPDAIVAALRRSTALLEACRLRIALHCHADPHVRLAMEPIAVAGDLACYAIAAAALDHVSTIGADADAISCSRRAWRHALQLASYMDAAQLPIGQPVGAYRIEVLL